MVTYTVNQAKTALFFIFQQIAVYLIPGKQKLVKHKMQTRLNFTNYRL